MAPENGREPFAWEILGRPVKRTTCFEDTTPARDTLEHNEHEQTRDLKGPAFLTYTVKSGGNPPIG